MTVFLEVNLASIEHVIQVVPSPYPFPDGAPEMLRHFLTGPIILDDFAHHADRRQWVQSCYRVFGEGDHRSIALANNPIKRGRLGSVLDLMRVVYGARGMERPDDAWYDALTDKDKIVFVDGVRQRIVDHFTNPN